MKTKVKYSIILLLVITYSIFAQSPKIIDLSKNWHFAPDKEQIGTVQKWYSNNFDDSHWDIIDAGKRWEDQGYPDLDSLAWYRKVIHIPVDWKGKAVWIKFGGVNDAYKLFINGKLIDSVDHFPNSSALETTFSKITKYLKYGEPNLVAVQINDWGNSGGLWRLPLIITTDESEINYQLNKNFPIIVMGDEQRQVNFDLQDGGLKPIVGVHNIQIYRAHISNYGTSQEERWTYNHHHDLAAWKGRLYAAWATTPKDEDVPPYRVVYATSKDGFHWSDPVDLFPEKLAWASRYYFFHAGNDRMLALCPAVLNDTTTNNPNLLVREIKADHSLGEVFTLIGPSPNLPAFYTASKDPGFVNACREAVNNNLLLEQGDYGILLGERRMKWHSLTPAYKGFYPFGKAFCFYHRKDGNMVGICKMGFVTISEDEGKTWSKPVNPPTLIVGAAKIWGQQTTDGRFAAAYNPSRSMRYPLVLIHGDDGKEFRDMRIVHGEFPVLRYPGLYKDIGPQYVRGLAEWADDGSFADNNALWLLYSVNKEDIWISRVPLPIKPDETVFPSDEFENVPSGSKVPGWNIYSPKWAPVSLVAEGSEHSIELNDADPFDNAHAVRTFPAVNKMCVDLQLMAAQIDSRLEIDLCDSTGGRPIRLALTKNGIIQACDGTNTTSIGKYKADEDIGISITTDLVAGTYSVQINNGKVNTYIVAENGVKSVERLSLRTGKWHGLFDKIGVDTNSDVPNDKPAVFHLKSVSISPLKNKADINILYIK